MTEKLLFGTNLKMYKNVKDTVRYLKELEHEKKNIKQSEMELFVIPSYTALYSASECIDQDNIMLGAQNMHWEQEGQFTGEISPMMLKELGIRIIMSGHSERRHIFKETEEDIHRKVRSALKHGFTSLLCVGETGPDKEIQLSKEVLRHQLKTAYHGVSDAYIPQLWVAYEPVWSIGVNGKPAEPSYAEEMHSEIKQCLKDIFGNASEAIPVLYGGSVNPENADKLMVKPNIDGLFVGRSAWDAKAFGNLITSVLDVCKK